MDKGSSFLRGAWVALLLAATLPWLACSDSIVEPPWPSSHSVIDTIWVLDTVKVLDTLYVSQLDDTRDTTRLLGALAWGGGPAVGSSADLISYLPNGRWGIGTTSPAAKLHVASGGMRVDDGRLHFRISGAYQGDNPAGFGLTLDRSSKQGRAPMGINFQQDASNLWGLGIDERTEDPYPDYVSVFQSSVGDVFRFRTGGRAILGNGIGHPEPHHVLTVQDKNNDFIENVLNLYIGPTGHGSRFIRAFDGQTIPFAVGRDGRVGVGRDISPSSMLAVNGEVEAQSFRRLSDVRLKAAVRPLGAALPTIRNLQPAAFKWRGSPNPGEEEFGLIAQEVEAILPDAVRENAAGFKTIDYQAVNIMLLKAVQELAAEVDSLRTEAGRN